MNAPTLTRNQTQAYQEDDDVLEELPTVKKTARFDGSKSTSTAESLVDFLQSFTWSGAKITDIPGIGPASASKLNQAGVSTVQQLVGAYMGFVEPGATSNGINNLFFEWFKGLSPNANGHTVTFAIAHLADRFGMVVYED
jgi:hypothetical protein